MGASRTYNARRKNAELFWSSHFHIPSGFSEFQRVEIPWDEFHDKILPRLESQGGQVGINCSYPMVLGESFSPIDVHPVIEEEYIRCYGSLDVKLSLPNYGDEVYWSSGE